MTIFNLEQFYRDRVTQHGLGVRSLDWGSEQSQRIRFEVLAGVTSNLAGQSVLDVGCGLADLHGFFVAKGIPVKYTGYDLMPEMLEAAARKYPGVCLRRVNICELADPAPEFDYVFASGLFGLLVENNEAFVRTAIQRLYALCRRGLSFNMLSAYAAKHAEGRYYARPEEVFAYCRSLCPAVVLRHEYLPNDFTLYLYKDLIQAP